MPRAQRGLNVIKIYTDGGCFPNPGKGGWAAIFTKNGGVVRTLSGGEKHTTNNRMEMTAVIEALRNAPEGESIKILSDSKLILNTAQDWMYRWRRLGWVRNRKGGEVKNLDLVKDLYEVVEACPASSIKWAWVKGHSGNRFNEMADGLAAAEVRAQ